MKLHRRWIAALAAACLSLTALGQERDPVAAPEPSVLDAGERVPESVLAELRTFKEKGELRKAALASCVAPDDYLDLLDRSGMKVAIEGGNQPLVGGWVPLGPFGNYSSRNGRIAGIQVVPTGGSTFRVYVGASAGGIWFSPSSALGTWTSIGDNIPHPSVRAFYVDPSNPQRIVVASGDPGRWKGGGLFYSTNGGGTWHTATLSGSTPEYCYRIVPVPGSSTTLYAATSVGLLRSITSGTVWTLVQSGNCTDVRWHPTDPLRGWASFQGSGLRRTLDGGATWPLLSSPAFPPSSQWGRTSIAICRDVPNVVAAMVEHQGGLRAVLRTTDGGANWTDVTGPLLDFGSNQGEHAHAIAIRPDDPNTMLVGIIAIASTTNGGATWTHGSGAIPSGHADITQLYFSPLTGDSWVWITNDGGIYGHALGSSTTASYNGNAITGLSVAQIHRLDADRSVRAIGLQDNGIVRSLDQGLTWSYLQGGDGGYVEITDPVVQRMWWADGIYPPPIWRASNKQGNGSTQSLDNPDTNSLPLVHDRYTDRVYTAGWTKLYSIPDGATSGTAWTLEADLGAANVPGGIWTMAGSPSDGRTFYVAHRKPNPTPPDVRISVCRKSGSTWTITHQVLPVPAGSEVWRATPSSEWPGECWVTVIGGPTTAKVLHTTDFGASWEDLTANLAGLTVRVVVPAPFDPRTLYAATDLGMYTSSDGGATWQTFQEGLAVAPVLDMRYAVDHTHTLPHRLVIGTFGRGVWQRDIAAPPIVYVDATATGPVQDGTIETPFQTIGAGVAAAPAGAIVAVRGHTYAAPLTIGDDVRVVTWAGTTVVE